MTHATIVDLLAMHLAAATLHNAAADHLEGAVQL